MNALRGKRGTREASLISSYRFCRGRKEEERSRPPRSAPEEEERERRKKKKKGTFVIPPSRISAQPQGGKIIDKKGRNPSRNARALIRELIRRESASRTFTFSLPIPRRRGESAFWRRSCSTRERKSQPSRERARRPTPQKETGGDGSPIVHKSRRTEGRRSQFRSSPIPDSGGRGRRLPHQDPGTEAQNRTKGTEDDRREREHVKKRKRERGRHLGAIFKGKISEKERQGYSFASPRRRKDLPISFCSAFREKGTVPEGIIASSTRSGGLRQPAGDASPFKPARNRS